ncbi:DNA primase [Calidifontibacter indicus]|uniref:Primosomal protein n=1 Tax=Calidifontibacter indicus TaxID=419650 RepID=A0A3D9UP71_9MICO|nr:DNA primase [Calidifontibacter indicus]REF31129.1 hypothetical protein DFJ65_2174 [Calidifontibacter indicus]
MSDDPRAALAVFVNALERHLELASSGRNPDDPHLREAYDALSDAFEAYDDALYDEYGVATPFFVPADEDDDFDDDFDEDDDDEENEDDEADEDDDLDDDELEEFEDDDEDDDEDAASYRGLDDEDIEYDDSDE